MWLRTGEGTIAVTFKGYLNGVELFSQVANPNAEYSQVLFNFAGIDRLTIIPDAPYNLLIDDIVVNQAEVPEPATLVLLGLGLLAFAASRNKMLRK